MPVFRDFFLWLERRQIGILTTVAVHLLTLSIILVLKIMNHAERDNSIAIDLSRIHTDVTEEENAEKQQQQQQQSAQDFVQSMQQEYHVRTVPVNTASERAVENIAKMLRDIKTEMNITDPPPQKDAPEEVAPASKDDRLLENEARIYDDKYPANAAGERTVYTGTTTVSYELAGRRHVWMPAPVYKCRAGGKIVVNIAVNGNGYVIAAEINKSRSDSEDPCIVEAARRDAERSRFNESAQAKQQGSITYIFQPQ